MDKSYETFRDPETQAMIAECGYRVADYMHQEQIGSLVLVDQAARNLHIPIRSAWNLEYPSDPKPTVYFLNPDGFLVPDIHDDTDYIGREHKMEYTRRGMAYGDYMFERMLNPFINIDAKERAFHARATDLQTNRRDEIAQELTGHIAQAIPKDERFNGRVLVLDACRHSGGAVEGITRAIRDVGVIDVRTGVVNNILNRGDDPDFIVFDDSEIKDDCKPFGIQSGLQRTDQMLPKLSPGGLDPNAKQAKRELHNLAKHLPELRDRFNDQRTQRKQIETLPRDVQALLDTILGETVRFDMRLLGGRDFIILSGSAEDGAANTPYPNVDWPQG